MPAWFLIILLVIFGMGAAADLVFKDSVLGTTTVSVGQALRIDANHFSPLDIDGGDEALPTVLDGGMEWRVHIEANNGDLITIDLPVANEANDNLVGELMLWGSGPFSYHVTSLNWWVDADHNQVVTEGEAVVRTDDGILDRSDSVSAIGLVDFGDFTSNHWFIDGSGSYNDGVFSDSDGDSPEAILLDDGDGRLDPGPLDGGPDLLLTPGRAGLAELIGPYASSSAAVGKLYFVDNAGGVAGRWESGEDLFLNNDGDGYFTGSADVLVDGDGATTPASGTAATITGGEGLEGLGTDDNLYWSDGDASGDFSTGDGLWLDSGDNGYFNAHGEAVSGVNPATDLSGLWDASLNIAFDGGVTTTYILDNSGAVTAGTLSTLGLENGAPAGLEVGEVVQVDGQGNNYLVNAKSADLDQRSTIQLIGDAATAGDDLKGQVLVEQTVSLGAGSGVYVNGAHTVGVDGRLTLTIDDGLGGLADASALDGGEVWALDNNGLLGPETIMTILDVDGGGAVSTLEVLGVASQGLPDNYQFYAVGLSGSANTANLDDFYLDSGSEIAASLEAALGAAGSASFSATGFSGRYKLDSASSASGSRVVVTPGTVGTDVADDLKLGLLNGGAEAGRDLILRGSPTDDTTVGSEIITGPAARFAYQDTDGDGAYDVGEDLYEEQTGGALSYSDSLDIIVYNGGTTQAGGGGPGSAGSPALPVEDSDNLMFLDSDHDGEYDFTAGTYEPLLYTGSGDIDPGGSLTAGVTVLARFGGDWPLLTGLDMYRLETDFNGANGHDYYYVDDDNDGAYDDGEAIMDQITGSFTNLLEAGDYLLHQGRAGLIRLPVVQSGLGLVGSTECCSNANPKPAEGMGTLYQSWKFMVPAVNNLGSPLDIRITLALEDSAPTGMYVINGELKPVEL